MREALTRDVRLPLRGITSKIPQDVRIEGLEPFINGPAARILFNTKHSGLLEELDSWPEKQGSHHYDGLTALELLWQVCGSRRLAGVPRVYSISANEQRLFV